LIKNGKHFVPIPDEKLDFKELFKVLATSGAGRPINRDGLPDGAWTPVSLAEAITNIEGNSEGVELRTVQLWFQENNRGISPKNIMWLARVFGCGDRLGVSEWQTELTASNRRLAASRRFVEEEETSYTSEGRFRKQHSTYRRERGFSLARWCDAIFSSTSLAVPSTVFAVGAALIFLSFFCGNHSFIHVTPEGYGKQIGFIWTANWTLVFTVFFPAFFVFAGNTLTYWKFKGQCKLGAASEDASWEKSVEANGYTFTLVFVLLLVFAGGVQWMSVRLFPLLIGEANYTTDWGSLAIEHPEVITIIEAIVFTGVAYLAMSLFFFGFYASLILLVTMAQGFAQLVDECIANSQTEDTQQIDRVGDKLIVGVFRCSILGLMSVIVMKLQGSYMESYGTNIIAWYLRDIASVFDSSITTNTVVGWGTPNHLASLLCSLAVVFTFAMGIYFIRIQTKSDIDRIKLIAVFGLLFVAYLTIGLFAGFAIVLTLAMMVATYAICDPKMNFQRNLKQGMKRRVL